MQQTACQWRATSGTSFNCIIFGMLREDRATWTSRDLRASGGPVPPGWWFSAQGLAIMVWASESGDHSASLASKHFGEAVIQCLARPSKSTSSLSGRLPWLTLERTLYTVFTCRYMPQRLPVFPTGTIAITRNIKGAHFCGRLRLFASPT
jgi:hypothetical protein